MRFLKLVSLVFLASLLLCAYSFFTNKNEFGVWKVRSATKEQGISWARFYWGGDSLSGKYYERAYMFVPVRMDDLPYTFRLQFDLGDPYTELYEKNLQSLFVKHTGYRSRYSKLKGNLQFWNNHMSFKSLQLVAGDLILSTEDCLVRRDFGSSFEINSTNDTLNIGTLGADVFQNRVLIIDYPNHRFAICDSVPSNYATGMVDMEFGKERKVVIPMILREKKFRITFDNGSSLFPLITLESNVNKFTENIILDSMRISSWGQYHYVTRRVLQDSFELAGQRFASVDIYSSRAGLGIDHSTDAMTGNALFWNKTVVIDFKNKKFGVK